MCQPTEVPGNAGEQPGSAGGRPYMHGEIFFSSFVCESRACGLWIFTKSYAVWAECQKTRFTHFPILNTFAMIKFLLIPSFSVVYQVGKFWYSSELSAEQWHLFFELSTKTTGTPFRFLDREKFYTIMDFADYL